MLTITESAQTEVARYFESNAVKPIRVFLNNSCCGVQLAMALDEAKPDDETFEVGGIQYLVDENLLTKALPIEIDHTPQGFKITSSLDLGGGCGDCGSAGTCCG